MVTWGTAQWEHPPAGVFSDSHGEYCVFRAAKQISPDALSVFRCLQPAGAGRDRFSDGAFQTRPDEPTSFCSAPPLTFGGVFFRRLKVSFCLKPGAASPC